MLKGFSDMFIIQLLHKKSANGFEFPLEYPASNTAQTNSLYFSNYNSTPLGLALTAVELWFHCSPADETCSKPLGLGVQFEDTGKRSFSESSHFNPCSPRLTVRAALPHALSRLLLQTWELRRLGMVTQLQVWTLLAEVPDLEDVDKEPGFLTLKCRCWSWLGRAPGIQPPLCDACAPASSRRTKRNHGC